MSRSNRISALWLNGPLRLVDQVCLASMAANHMDVTLYTYGTVNNVPEGIRVANGEDVLSLDLIDRLAPIAKSCTARPTQHFSDFFRIECQRLGLGMWLDTDILLLRKFSYDSKKMYFAKENMYRIGFSAIYLPMTNPICEDYYELRYGADLTPHWLGFRRRVIKPFIYNMMGREYSSSDLGITIYANDGFTRLAKNYGFWKHAKPKKWMYHWTGKKNYRVFNNYNFEKLLNDDGCIGLHILKKGAASTHAVPGSLWDWALNRYGP